MKRTRHMALLAAALLALFSYAPHWPADAWHWLATRSYNPAVWLEWLVCPNYNVLSTEGCRLTLQQKLVRALVVSAPLLVAGIAVLLWKAKKGNNP